MKPGSPGATFGVALWGGPLGRLNLEPRLQPGLFLSAWQALVKEGRPFTQGFSNPLVDCKCLISNIGEQGCVRSVLGARVRLSGRSHPASGSKGEGITRATPRIYHADGLP
jgi:hypothetical protein